MYIPTVSQCLFFKYFFLVYCFIEVSLLRTLDASTLFALLFFVFFISFFFCNYSGQLNFSLRETRLLSLSFSQRTIIWTYVRVHTYIYIFICVDFFQGGYTAVSPFVFIPNRGISYLVRVSCKLFPIGIPRARLTWPRERASELDQSSSCRSGYVQLILSRTVQPVCNPLLH